jgi:Spy/CpxP family protein refolding chaperone
MKAFSRWVAYGAMAGALSLVACGSSVDADSAALAQGEIAESPPEVAHMGLLREALAKVSLRPEQRPIVEQLDREAQARHEPMKQARIALRSALADQIAAGKIDRAALKPQLDALLSAIDQSRAGDRVALGRLHDILDANQRGQFVDALEAEFRGKGHHPHGGAGGMHRWASDLNLTSQQTGQIRDALKTKFADQREAMKEQFRSMREQGQKMLEAFRHDQLTLDANTPIFGRPQVERRVEKMLDIAEVAVPLLTPEQRAIAAQKIRARGGNF